MNQAGGVRSAQTSPKTCNASGLRAAKTRRTKRLSPKTRLRACRVNSRLCATSRLCRLLRGGQTRLLKARDYPRRRIDRACAARGRQIFRRSACAAERCLTRRRLCPSSVNRRLRSGGRRLRRLNSTKSGLTQCLTRALHRSAGRVDRSGSVDCPLLCSGPRTKARGRGLSPG